MRKCLTCGGERAIIHAGSGAGIRAAAEEGVAHGTEVATATTTMAAVVVVVEVEEERLRVQAHRHVSSMKVYCRAAKKIIIKQYERKPNCIGF